MRPLCALFSCLLAACAPATPAPRAVVTPVSAAPIASASAVPHPDPPLSPETALAEAQQRFANARVTSSYDVDDHAVELRNAGLDEARTVALIEALLRKCLAQNERCEGMGILERAPDDPVIRAGEILIAQLAQVGEPGSLPLLMRLSARDVPGAEAATEQILQRRAISSNQGCAPPSAAALEAERAGLSDFAVIEHDGKQWVGRAPTPQELDDLAYFLVTVQDAGPPAGTTLEKGPAPGPPSQPNPQREALSQHAKAARMQGDVRANVDATRAYLMTLGYPGPLRATEESTMTWGGPGYAYVMRDLALSLEILGEFDEAAALYRRANPGGGGCGTSVPYRRMFQTRGLIRTLEQAHGCRPTVADRLYDDDDGRRKDWYGPTRLAEAGLDLARLYRGALLTRGRDIEEPKLRAALSNTKGPLGNAALMRLEKKGPEAWEPRTRALEGYADVGGKEAIGRLLLFARQGAPELRARAIRTLGRLLELRRSDPCRKGGLGWSRVRGVGSDRTIHSLQDTCATKIPAQELESVRRALAALARDLDADVRVNVARALGRLSLPLSKPTLQTLLSDPFAIKGSTLCTTTGGKETCRPNQPVREAAREALEWIDEVQKREREMQKREAKHDAQP